MSRSGRPGEHTTIMLVFTTNKERLSEHFQKDPVLFAYHLGDLDDFYFKDCQWGATYGFSFRTSPRSS